MKEVLAKSSARRFRRVLLVGLISFAGIQFIPVSRNNPPVKTDFISVAGVPEQEAQLLHAACYDCHSYETRWPWYMQVAPVSWWNARYVREGREHLNFSAWPQAKPWDARTKLESIAQVLRNNSMPPSDYRLLQPAAKLSPADRTALASWADTNAAKMDLKRSL